MRIILALILLILVVGAGAYWGSPYYTVWRLDQAAKALDARATAGSIDLPAVRANLSPALAARFQSAIDTEKTKPHSILDRIGMAIAPFLNGKPAEVLVTPEALAVMLKTAAPPRYVNPFDHRRPADSAYPGEPYVVREHYVDNDLDQFSAAIGNRLRPGAEVRLKLLRFGFFTWKITTLDLDQDAPLTGGATTGASTTTVMTNNTSD